MDLIIAEDIKNGASLLVTDIIIAFMGPYGSGKSNIIDTLTNQPGRRAGSRWNSCTTEVRAARLFNHPVYGDRLVLVDTPDFDDTYKSDLEMLQMVSNRLEKTYERDIKLAGIIYLLRITDNPMPATGRPHCNLHMFGELCGDQAVKKVMLVTTMWDKVQPDIGVHRERDLVEKYWRTMINYGASTARFLNSAGSAWEIVDLILKRHETEYEVPPRLLREETVEFKRALNESQAGKMLYSDLQKLLAEKRDTIPSRSLTSAVQAQGEDNPQLALQLETKLQKDFDKTFNEMKRLKVPFWKWLMLLIFGKK